MDILRSQCSGEKDIQVGRELFGLGETGGCHSEINHQHHTNIGHMNAMIGNGQILEAISEMFTLSQNAV